MKFISFLFLIFPIVVLASGEKSQVFSNFSGSFKLASIDSATYSTSFAGRQQATGEIVFEIALDENQESSVRSISFIPDDPNLFPAVASGFYAKAATKIELINTERVKELLFLDFEWRKALAEQKSFISKRGSLELKSYTTTIECDTRQYFAEMVSFSASQEVSFFETRSELAGC